MLLVSFPHWWVRWWPLPMEGSIPAPVEAMSGSGALPPMPMPTVGGLNDEAPKCGAPAIQACVDITEGASSSSSETSVQPCSSRAERRRRHSNSRPIVDILHNNPSGGGTRSPGDLPYSLPGARAQQPRGKKNRKKSRPPNFARALTCARLPVVRAAAQCSTRKPRRR